MDKLKKNEDNDIEEVQKQKGSQSRSWEGISIKGIPQIVLKTHTCNNIIKIQSMLWNLDVG